MSKEAKRYTPRFKFQVVMETFKSSKPIGQIARPIESIRSPSTSGKRNLSRKGLSFLGRKQRFMSTRRK